MVFVPAGANLQTALNMAPAGAIVELEPGAEYAPVHLPPGKPGTLRTRGAAIASGTTIGMSEQLAILRSATNVAALRAGGRRRRVDGRRDRGPYDPAGGHGDQHRNESRDALEQLPRRVFLRHIIVRGGEPGIRRCVGLHGIDVELVDRHISGCWRLGQDSQAVWINHGNGIRVLNNYLEAASENLMTGGAGAAIPNESPRNVTIVGNTFTKNQVWRSSPHQVKNLLEFKHVRGAIVRGNVFDGNWPDAQDGTAILFSPRASNDASPWSVVEDVLVENNVVRHVSDGIDMTGEDDGRASLRTNRIVIWNNLIIADRNYRGVPSKPQSLGRVGAGRCMTVGRYPQSWFERNTCIANGDAPFYIYAGGEASRWLACRSPATCSRESIRIPRRDATMPSGRLTVPDERRGQDPARELLRCGREVHW